MSQIKRKIHVIGINSFEFEELPLKLQNLFIETVSIAIPDSYFKDIQLWGEKYTKQKKLLVHQHQLELHSRQVGMKDLLQTMVVVMLHSMLIHAQVQQKSEHMLVDLMLT